MAIITISRGTYSGGKKLAELVAEKTGYRCLERAEVVVNAAQSNDIAFETLTHALLDPPGVLDRMRKERSHYIAFVQNELVKEVMKGNVVYHGNAGHFLLGGVRGVLKVRVIADMEFRIQNAMQRRGVDRKEAIHNIEEIDKKRAKWTKFLYHADWQDPSLYDMVINLEQMSIETAAQVVCQVAASGEFQPDEETDKQMKDLLLSTQIRSEIATDGRVDSRALHIHADNGDVTLSGTLGSTIDADRIHEIVKKVPGVNNIHSRMQMKW